MKKGIILVNPWVSNGHPFRKFMYMGTKGIYFEAWYVYENKIEKAMFYKKDLKMFEICGRSESYDNFIKDLKEDLKTVENK